MEYRKKKIAFSKQCVYIVLLLFLYTLQVTPHLLNFGYAKPNLLICMVVSLAMYEDEFIGGIYGFFAGALWDLGAFTVFGIGTMSYLLGGCSVGLLTIYLVQNNIKAAIYITLVFSAMFGIMDYFFTYGMWRYQNASMMLWEITIPSIIYTTLAICIVHFVVGKIKLYFDSLAEEQK